MSGLARPLKRSRLSRMRHHTLAKFAFLVSALVGTVLPILVLGAPELSAPRSGEGPDLGAIVQHALQAAGEIEEGQNKSVVLLDLARFQLRTGAREAAKEATRQAIQSGRAIRSPIRSFEVALFSTCVGSQRGASSFLRIWAKWW